MSHPRIHCHSPLRRAGGLLALLLLAACRQESTVTLLTDLPAGDTARLAASIGDQNVAEDLDPRLLRRFAALHKPPSTGETPLVGLGRLLYYEPLLSSTGTVSCNSCHPLDRYGTTNTKFSVGVNGHLGVRNAPTVYNLIGHARFFWDGRAETLAEQVAGPLGNPLEMGMRPGQAVAALRAVPGYRSAFSSAFPGDADPITIEHIAAAIAAFERGLVTPARWDRYLDGDKQSLTPYEKEGARLFANLGCMVCHTGAYVGGTMFEKLGIFVQWPNQSDHGREAITKNPADRMVFKVPSLRNVARTAPYFHDGSVDSLDTAVRLMAHHQLGVDLTEEEARSIAAFLGSLTGDIPQDYIKPPTLPAAARR